MFACNILFTRSFPQTEVEVEFERPSYTVDEGDGSVTVCLVRTGTMSIARAFTVNVTSRESVPRNATG